MNRPHVLVNAAMTADGKIDSTARQAALISSPADSARVDRLRAEVDAIMVGGRTLLEGDPRLTVKSPALRALRQERGLSQNPAKVGVVSAADLRSGCRFLSDGPARRLIYTTTRTTTDQAAALRLAGAEVFLMGDTRVDLVSALDSLSRLGIHTLMVEGGGTLIASLLELRLVDELMLYIAPRIFGGTNAPALVGGVGFPVEQAPRLSLVALERFDDEGGILVHYTIRGSGSA
jgi:2,5-diamino-6-(ribosylamino)-4(3H)-pyrimidinone 5'-phosphate reductase